VASHPGVRWVPTPLSCPGSLRPVEHLKPGDEVVCEFCRARLKVIPPPTSTLCRDVAKDFPRVVFCAGKLVFEKERWYQKLLRTAFQLQRRLQFAGLHAMVLPVRVRAEADEATVA